MFPLHHSSSLKKLFSVEVPSKKLFYICLKARECDTGVPCRTASTRCSQGHWKERGSSPAILTYISSLLHSIQAVGTVCYIVCCFPDVKRAPFPPEVLEKMSIPNMSQNNWNIRIWKHLKDSWHGIIQKIKPFLSCRYKWAFSQKRQETQIIYQPDR